MGLPSSSRRMWGYHAGGFRVMGAIPQPHRWLNGCRWNRPNFTNQFPVALPNAQAPAVMRPGIPASINRPIPRNLFPGRVSAGPRPRGW